MSTCAHAFWNMMGLEIVFESIMCGIILYDIKYR